MNCALFDELDKMFCIEGKIVNKKLTDALVKRIILSEYFQRRIADQKKSAFGISVQALTTEIRCRFWGSKIYVSTDLVLDWLKNRGTGFSELNEVKNYIRECRRMK